MGARPSGALRSSAQEFGNGPCVGPGRVFHMLLALGEGPERGWPVSCRGATGRAVGCGAQSPPTSPMSVPKAIHRELAEAWRPLPDTCSHAGAQLALCLPLRAQTQTPYLPPTSALSCPGLSPSLCHLDRASPWRTTEKERHTQIYTGFIILHEFQTARGPGRRQQGSHLGFCKHLPALQLAHLDQCSRQAHVRTGSGSDPIAAGCRGGKTGIRQHAGSEACLRPP